MIRKSNNGTPFYQFANLLGFDGIRHGIFTRHAGCSRGPFRSLNVAYGLGDDEENVQKNRRIISQSLPGAELVFIEQVHGSRVLVLTGADPDSVHCLSQRTLVGDAMITDIPQQFLVVQIADCQSVLMVDPFRRVVANVHCGWRGSVDNIIGRSVEAMQHRFGCRPDQIVAGIGPSLGPCCAEFVNYQTEIPEALWDYRVGDNHFDFWSISRDQLTAAGLSGEKIESGNVCTRCHTEEFFSYRGEGVTGRFASVIGMLDTSAESGS